MLTLKIYNNLPSLTRRHIARIVFGHMSDEFINEMAQPFRHNFEYDMGHWYKLMLDHCSYNKAKKHITVSVHIPVDVK